MMTGICIRGKRGGQEVEVVLFSRTSMRGKN